MDYETTLLSEHINGRYAEIHQRMLDISDGHRTYENGPFVTGLKYATIDGHQATTEELRTVLAQAGRDDLLQYFKVP